MPGRVFFRFFFRANPQSDFNECLDFIFALKIFVKIRIAS